MSERTVNVPLLRKAVEWAEAEAAKPWELCEWYQVDVSRSPDRVRSVTGATKAPKCGTCYCIAGYVAALDGYMEPGDSRFDNDRWDYAAERLGLTNGQDELLFAATNTITQVREIAESIAGERL